MIATLFFVIDGIMRGFELIEGGGSEFPPGRRKQKMNRLYTDKIN